jgi:NAD+ synthase (glutamine-hydrolysing)
VLDEILELYIEQRMSEAELVSRGFDESLVQRIIRLVASAEWKRRQGAIGPKISSMSYGRDRRMPITNKFK